MTTQSPTILMTNVDRADPVLQAVTTRRLIPASMAILVTFAVLTAVATNQLFVLSSHTREWFAWTIAPPLSAAFVGAGYAAGFVLVVLAARSRSWVQARMSMATVWIFATLTLVATLSHLSKFHFHAVGTVARFAAWFWLGIYIVVPIVLGASIVAQCRVAGPDTHRRPSLPLYLAAVLTGQGLVMLGVGAVLFFRPSGAAAVWPWALTPLTAQMVAAWLIAFGSAALFAVLERDLHRLRAAAVGYTVFGALQLAALLRFRTEIHWHAAPASIYVAVLASVVLAGLAGWRMSVPPARSSRQAVAGTRHAATDDAPDGDLDDVAVVGLEAVEG
jgi:hypothetical protein